MSTAEKDAQNITMNKPSFEEYIVKRLKETMGAVEATSSEMHEQYFRLKQQGHLVEQISDGIGQCVGTFYGHQVYVSLRWYKIDGVYICFYEATSVVVNHDMVKEWIKSILPHLKPNALNDAMNIHNTLNAAGCERTIKSVEASIKHIDNEYKYQTEQLQKSLKIKVAEKELQLLKQS